MAIENGETDSGNEKMAIENAEMGSGNDEMAIEIVGTQAQRTR